MTDLNIPELRKLALAANKINAPINEVDFSLNRGAICFAEREEVALHQALDTATILELLRLAEIGQMVEAGEVNF